MALDAFAREIGTRRRFRCLLWKFGSGPGPGRIHLVHREGEEEDGIPCGADSGEQIDRETAELWPFEHTAEHPEHRSYGHLAYRPMVTVPREEPT